ncbi:MAG: hypothetical protein JRJ64_13910 [Deltaproteobacteria bacterium]|nr:hypothetical protein [Deltaproteobacteria bacterium]
MRISNSFSEGEIQVLEFMKRVEEKKSQAKLSSSVGTVAAADDDDLHLKAG